MTQVPLTPSRVWKQMSPALRLHAARALWLDTENANDQIQAAMLISQQKKFRPKTVLSLDLDRKSKHLASLGSLPDALAARVLVAYHLTEQRPMMGAFLDGLGIAHEDGLISEEDVKPDQEKLGPAVASLTAAFPAEQVSLYLNTLLCQDPETWGALASLVEQPAAT